jgi:hypothetical protein
MAFGDRRRLGVSGLKGPAGLGWGRVRRDLSPSTPLRGQDDNKDNGKGDTGVLHYADPDETVVGFGRNDGFIEWVRKAKQEG